MNDSNENSVLELLRATEWAGASRSPASWIASLPSFRYLEITRHAGWLKIVLNNGQSNYITEGVAHELALSIAAASQCDAIHCIVLGGGEKRVFSRGLELKTFLAASVDEQLRFIERANLLLSSIATAHVPVICGVNGFCAGAGLELAVACDVRIVSENATFSSPEVMFGLVPGGGVLQRLLRMVGRGQCVKLLSTGETISATEAFRIGLVEEVVAPDMVARRCEFVARRLARASRAALVAMKQSVVEGGDRLMSPAIQFDLRQSMEALQQLRYRTDRQQSHDQEPALLG